jgi:hypothetical protein
LDALGRLVQDQHPRRGDECPGDRQLLLARPRPLVIAAVAIVVVVLVRDNFFSRGLLEAGRVLLVLLPLLASVVPASFFYVWARRRGDLD